MSDDHRSSIVVIALLGNPFSPRYARARDDGSAFALDHSAMNVAVDAPGVRRWALTERRRDAVARDEKNLAIGRSRLHRASDGAIVVDVDERSSPFLTPIRGRVVLRPVLASDTVVRLDANGSHRWTPRMPLARVEVELVEPRVRFTGTGYLDENDGDEALEAAFTRWSWSRVASAREVGIAYDVELRDGTRRSHGMRLSADGTHPFAPAHAVDLGRSRFALSRGLRVEEPSRGRLVRTLEDGPFYARSVVETSLAGAPAVGVHETVCLERFSSRWVQFLIPFRMRVEAA